MGKRGISSTVIIGGLIFVLGINEFLNYMTRPEYVKIYKRSKRKIRRSVDALADIIDELIDDYDFRY